MLQQCTGAPNQIRLAGWLKRVKVLCLLSKVPADRSRPRCKHTDQLPLQELRGVHGSCEVLQQTVARLQQRLAIEEGKQMELTGEPLPFSCTPCLSMLLLPALGSLQCTPSLHHKQHT